MIKFFKKVIIIMANLAHNVLQDVLNAMVGTTVLPVMMVIIFHLMETVT